MDQKNLFERETVLPNEELSKRDKSLIGFGDRYDRVKSQINLLFNLTKLEDWCKDKHGMDLQLRSYISEQYPFIIFHGDVGTGKTVTAECIANRIIIENRGIDAILYKLSNQVRGSGLVGEGSSNLAEALKIMIKSAGKTRQAILLIDEGDSLGASRAQIHSHHEDKVSVNTLIQGVDELRQYNGRFVVILCTNRIAAMDSALVRRAAIIEEFNRPTDSERAEMFRKDFAGLNFSESQIQQLVLATDKRDDKPNWTYSDIRTRLYPLALAQAFPDKPLEFAHVISVAKTLDASPKIEGT